MAVSQTHTENRESKRGRPFVKGHTGGNRAGRKPGSKNKPTTLPVAEAVAALELERKGHPPSVIARMLNAKPDAVRDVLANGHKLLELFSTDFARYWRVAAWRAAKRGDHRPAMAGMLSAKAIEPIAQTYDTNGASAKAVAGVQVQLVGFTCAGLPGQAQPAIDVTTTKEGQ